MSEANFTDSPGTESKTPAEVISELKDDARTLSVLFGSIVRLTRPADIRDDEVLVIARIGEKAAQALNVSLDDLHSNVSRAAPHG